MNYKIRVTPEQSKQIQEICFGMGIYWLSSKKVIIRPNENFLYIGSYISFGDNENFFLENEAKEITAEDFIKKYGKKEEKKEAVRIPYTFETFPKWASVWVRVIQNTSEELVLNISSKKIETYFNSYYFSDTNYIQISPDRVNWFPFYREEKEEVETIYKERKNGRIVICEYQEEAKKRHEAEKQKKETPWYEQIPPHGKLCWVWDDGAEEKYRKQHIAVVKEKIFSFFCHPEIWDNAEPLTKEEIEQFLPNVK